MRKRTRKPVYPRVVEELERSGIRPGFVAEKLFMTVENFAHHIAGHNGMRFNLRELTTMSELFSRAERPVSVEDLKGSADGNANVS